jgi:hypothetical protein
MLRRLLVALVAVGLLAPASALAQDPTTTTSSDSRAPVVLLIVVGALLLAAGVTWAVARWWAYEAPWVLRARHAADEAGWRTSAAWAEFKDWLRLGR